MKGESVRVFGGKERLLTSRLWVQLCRCGKKDRGGGGCSCPLASLVADGVGQRPLGVFVERLCLDTYAMSRRRIITYRLVGCTIISMACPNGITAIPGGTCQERGES